MSPPPSNTGGHPFENRVNPFENNIVRQPREAPSSVAGLNDAALDALVDRFAGLDASEPPRVPPVRPPKAQLVVSPDRGYGKTHLLGRLFANLEGRASTIYLTPFQDPNKPWQSILRMTIYELIRPSDGDACQLETLAIGVLAHLGADFLGSGGIQDYEDAAPAAEFLRRLGADPKLDDPERTWIDWLTAPETVSGLVRRLRLAGFELGGREKAWLLALAAAARDARYSESWTAAVKWLRAEPLEPDEAQRLQIDLADNDGQGDSSPQEINDLCYGRMRGLCALASFHRPFLFCFDQTEAFVGDHALIKTLGKCIQQLIDVLPNHLTVVTANQLNWLDDIRPHMETPHWDRFSDELVNLEGVRKDVAAELLRMRLTSDGLDEQAIGAFFAGNWLDGEFSTQEAFGVRNVLTRAAERFRELAKQPAPPPVTLEALFDAELQAIRNNPALQSFDPDALLWFVKDIGPALTGVSVGRMPNSRYFSLHWRWPDRRICFAFEGGHDHRRWGPIAREASALAKGALGAFSACAFRTPDLPGVPRPTWKAVAEAFKTAQAHGFQVVNLPAERFCEVLAARELYSNALQGNIAFSGPDALAWLRERFAIFLNELASGVGATASPQASDPPGPSGRITALSRNRNRTMLPPKTR